MIRLKKDWTDPRLSSTDARPVQDGAKKRPEVKVYTYNF